MRLFFVDLRFIDLLDIGIVAFILYQLYRLMRGTIAVQIFLGLMALYVLDVLVTAADMTMLRVLFSAVSEVFVLAVIILFQPEIRRLLFMLGRNPWIRRFISTPDREIMINEVVAAVEEMSRNRIGALMAFARTTGLRNYIETGTQIQAKVSKDFLISIFFPKNPLHDGAVIIQSHRIEAARCILPVSHSMRMSPHLGLRHRAGVGLSEQTDAFVVIVSEETGEISIAENGELTRDLTIEEFRGRLIEALSPEAAGEQKLEVVET